MRKPRFKDHARMLGCALTPLRAASILFLIKKQKLSVAVALLSLHLRVFHGIRLHSLQGEDAVQSLAQAKPEIKQALGCLGFISLFYRLQPEPSQSTEPAQAYPPDTSRSAPDPMLSDFLQGRSLAIVGPSGGSDNQAEIDGFDCVLRIGYSGPQSLPEGTGERCDIAFYARHKIDHLIDTGQLEHLEVPKLVIVKKNPKKLEKSLRAAAISPPQITYSTPPRFPLSSANALVEALFNALLCNPARIKIFNADLFLTNRYPVGYIGNKGQPERNQPWGYSTLDMCKSLALSHYPHEQLEFYKHYRALGQIELDATLEEIVSMPAADYTDQLDQIYGLPLRRELGLG